MKKMSLSIAAFFVLGAGGVAWGAEKTDAIKVSGWHCGGCASKTAAFVKKLEGVKSVETDKAKNEVEVKYDDAKVSRAQIEKAIADSGYSVGK